MYDNDDDMLTQRQRDMIEHIIVLNATNDRPLAEQATSIQHAIEIYAQRPKHDDTSMLPNADSSWLIDALIGEFATADGLIMALYTLHDALDGVFESLNDVLS